MGKEIERKYRVQSDAWRQQAHSKREIRQGYLSTAAERSVRVRLEEEQAFLTIKGEQVDQTRPEFEYPLPVADANQLIENLCIKPLIVKTRHKVQVGELTWEIDEFAGENSPLVLAEVETPTQEPPAQQPEWLGEEVSNDARYLNVNLVAHPYGEWAAEAHQLQPQFHLKQNESLAAGLQRIVAEELEAAMNHLNQHQASLAEAVHGARKSLKKLRSMLRLLHPVLDADFAQENEALRRIGRKLSKLRDAHALIETLDYLNAEYRTELTTENLATLRQRLLEQIQQCEDKFDSTHQIPQFVEALQQVQQRAQAWPYPAADVGILAKGIATTVRRGRNQFHAAYAKPRPTTFHAWRKRTKDLRYQLTLLKTLWPEVFAGYVEAAQTLEEYLGMDHNLVVLRDTLLKQRATLAADEEIQQLLPIIEMAQKKLRKATKMQGERLYSEKPNQWRRRIETSWQAWKKGKK